MSTEIKIIENVDNGEKVWLPRRTGEATVSGPNPKFRQATAIIKITFDDTDLAQAETALVALDVAHEVAKSHLAALRAIAKGA